MEEFEKAIFTNMCMITDGKGNVLVQNRRKANWPGIAFPGGHVEPEESFVASVIREVWEETGLTVENPTLCGVKQFPLEGGGRYVVLLFRADRFSGELHSSDEGEVFWINRQELDTYHLSNDFADMVKVFESSELSEFYYSVKNGEWNEKLL